MRTFKFLIEKTQDSKRLDQALFYYLSLDLEKTPIPGFVLSKGIIRKLVVAGAVYLNGKRIRIASRSIRSGSELKVYLDIAKTKSNEKEMSFQITPEMILFEDADLIILNKPAGIPTQPTLDEARNNLYKALQKYLDIREGKITYVALHHRLDLDTSGVILFSKNKSVNSKLTEMFKEHRFEKIYLAIVYCESKLDQNFSLDNFLGVVSTRGKQKIMGDVKSGGDRAITSFKLLCESNFVKLIEARPKTGRTHQIRAHLAQIKAPILGDTLYGSKIKNTRVMLHAQELRFIHPSKNIPLQIKAALPEDFLNTLKQYQLKT